LRSFIVFIHLRRSNIQQQFTIKRITKNKVTSMLTTICVRTVIANN